MPRAAQLLWGGVFAALFAVLTIFGARGVNAAIETNSGSDEILRLSAEYGALILLLATVAFRLLRGDRTGRASLLPIGAFWLVSVVFLIVAIVVYVESRPTSVSPGLAGASLRFSLLTLALSVLAAASAIAAHGRRREPSLPPVTRKDP